MENSTIKTNIKGVPLSKKVLVTVGQASILFNLDREEVEEILHSSEEENLFLLYKGDKMIKRKNFSKYISNCIY